MTDPTQPGYDPNRQNGAGQQPPAGSGQDPQQYPAAPPPYQGAGQQYPGQQPPAQYPYESPQQQAYPGADQPTQQYATTQQYPGAAPYGSAYPGPVDYANRTNPVAVVALVLGFLVPIGGIIAGAVALGQIRRTAEKGRGLAIAGIAVGSGIILFAIIAVVSLFAVLGFAASQNTGTDTSSGSSGFSDDTPTDDTPSDDTPSTDDGTGDGTDTDAFSLSVGDCFNDPSLDEVSSVTAVDCATPHDYEVYSDGELADAATYPGEDAVIGEADSLCYDGYAAYVGVPYEESTLDYYYLYPTEASWGEGDRLVSCLLADPAGQTTGSLQGSAR